MWTIRSSTSRTAQSKFCSHLATSELKSVWKRAKEPPNIGSIKSFISCSQNLPKGETFKRLGTKISLTARAAAAAAASIRSFSCSSGVVEGLYGSGSKTHANLKPTTIPMLQSMKKRNKKISMITAYDYTSGLLCDKAGADILLVGDSVGMVVLGHETTVPVTMDDMVHHIKAVKRATSRPLIVGDMPFGSYLDPQSAAVNACRLIKEGGCDAVKLEGGKDMASRIRVIAENGIAVQGHIGLLPQQVSSIGGYRVQGKTAKDALRLMEDALALQEAGCFSIVLEMVPDEVANAITLALDIPTIGIGAGPRTSGQVQVFHDICGLYDKLSPKFSKKYASLSENMIHAVSHYCSDVQTSRFPTMEEHTFTMSPKQYSKFADSLWKEYPKVADKMKGIEKMNDICVIDGLQSEEEVEKSVTKAKVKLASSLIAEQWREKMIQAYHQEAIAGGQRTSLRQFSSLVATDDEYASYSNVKNNRNDDRPFLATSLEELRSIRHNLIKSHVCSPPSIGFVPTMGSLHGGHLDLVEKAKINNDIVVVSIYVNPTQFGENEDLDVYPRNFQKDMNMLSDIGGVDVVYAPKESLYHDSHQTWVVPDIDGEYDEGRSRPGFFRGVATVVTKLLNHVQPDTAYFGQKDAQQAAVIQDLVRDLNIGCMTGESGMSIQIVPTVRESDGLAMSSRNAYLSVEERKQATSLFEALTEGRKRCLKEGGESVGNIRSAVLSVLNERGVSDVEYVTVADVRTTAPIGDDEIVSVEMNRSESKYMIATAVKIGTTRLIDNVVF
jgi:3-methyl-2-oxobutanoate hydroxymethyltransferase